MKFRLESVLLALAMVVLSLTTQAWANTTITYQGQLEQDGQPFSGTVDMVFELTGPRSERIGNPVIELEDVLVTAGLFQVELDFGDVPYEEGAGLTITVEGQELSPSQSITATPLAVRSLDGGSRWAPTDEGIIFSEGQVRVGTPGSSTRTFAVRSLAGEDPLIVFNSDGNGVLHGRENQGVSIGLGTTAPTPSQGLRVAGRSQFDDRVGLGTSTPESQFEVRGQDDRRFFAGDFTGGGFAATAFTPNGSTAFLAGPPGSQSAFFIGDPVVLGSNTELLVSSDASIGGTLQAGMIQVEALTSATDINLCRSPLAGGGAFLAQCNSSARYKDSIEDLENASHLIEDLRAVSFRWIQTGDQDIGLIAEEVAKVEPRLATYGEDGEVQGVKYRHLTAVLIKALQEHRADTVRELAARDEQLAFLQAELDTQRRETVERLAALEALLLDGPEVASTSQ